MKKLDIKGICVDIMRNLISAFLITFMADKYISSHKILERYVDTLLNC